jgi:hypothetical protein
MHLPSGTEELRKAYIRIPCLLVEICKQNTGPEIYRDANPLDFIYLLSVVSEDETCGETK